MFLLPPEIFNISFYSLTETMGTKGGTSSRRNEESSTWTWY